MDQFRDSSEGIYEKRRQARDRRCVIITVVATGIVAFIIGILIGRFATCPDEETLEVRSGVFLEGVTEKLMEDADPDVSKILIDGIRADYIRENLRLVFSPFFNS